MKDGWIVEVLVPASDGPYERHFLVAIADELAARLAVQNAVPDAETVIGARKASADKLARHDMGEAIIFEL